MKLKKLIFATAIGFALCASPLVMADSTTAQMSKIMLQLNHYPSAQEKTWLNQVAADNAQTAAVRTVARAMANLEHKAADADKAKLTAVIDDKSAPENVRELARIVRDLNHKPSAEDQKRLSAMASN